MSQIPVDLGLTRASEAELKRLLRALHRGTLAEPITRSGLIAGGFGHAEDILSAVVGMHAMPARKVITAVLAERAAKKQGTARVVARASDADDALDARFVQAKEIVVFGDASWAQRNVKRLASEASVRAEASKSDHVTYVIFDEQSFAMVPKDTSLPAVLVDDRAQTQVILYELRS